MSKDSFQNLVLAIQDFFKPVIIPFVASRLLLFAIGFMALKQFPISPFAHDLNEVTFFAPIRMWARWDALWYLSIARDGYSFMPGQQSNVAFFPLYPMLMRAGGRLFGGSDSAYLFSGLLVSNLACLLSLALLYRLLRRDFPERAAERASLYLSIFPSSLFLSGVYPNSLALALCLGAFLAARSGRWWLAGLLAGLQALCRVEGVLIAAPLLYEYILQRRGQTTPLPRRRDVAALALIPLALACWCVYLWIQFGDPFAFRTTLLSWEGADVGYTAGARRYVDYAFAAFFCGAALFSWRRLRPSYTVHMIVYASLLLALGLTRTVSFGSVMRYGLILFPVFALMADWGSRHEDFHHAVMILSAGLMAFFMAMFALAYWVA